MSAFLIDRHGVYRAALLSRFPWLEHGFGTRETQGWPDAARLVTLHQIHSDHVVRVDGGTPPGRAGEGDALVTNCPGILLGVRTADCVPVLIADPARGAVAAVHAGWRGTAAGIALKTVDKMRSEFGSNPGDLCAAIGPAIRGCCYEVGPEVAELLAPLFPERQDLRGRVRVDLVEANRRQLLAAGLSQSQIATGAPCTFCTPILHSYRRDRSSGRMVSAIGVASGADLP